MHTCCALVPQSGKAFGASIVFNHYIVVAGCILFATIFLKIISHSFRRSSSPNRTHCVGLRFSFNTPFSWMHLYRLSITIRIEFDLAEIFGRRPCEFTAHSRRGPEAPLGILPHRTAVFSKNGGFFFAPRIRLYTSKIPFFPHNSTPFVRHRWKL